MLAQSADSASSTSAARSEQARRPEDALRGIRAHLGAGRYRTAQRLAEEAAARFPEHEGIRTMNRGLNQREVRTRPASGDGRSEEFEWLRNPPESARGKWVALIGSEMVAMGEALAEVMESLKTMNLPKTPLVHRVE
jgi:hypothetical protein